MIKNHKIDANEFLEFVHDIDISWLPKDKILREELIKIKEKKIIMFILCWNDINQVIEVWFYEYLTMATILWVSNRV